MATRKTDKPLLLSAMLGNIEVEGVDEDVQRSYYSVSLYVADIKVAESTKSKPRWSAVRLEWEENNEIFFEPSSTVKIELYRGYRHGDILKVLVGKHEGKVVDLLENDISLDLTGFIALKMKIVFSHIPGSGDNIKEIMKRIDDDVSLMDMSGLPSTLSALGHVLKSTKAIMDQLSQVHPILNASWNIVSSLYEAVKETDLQDDSIRELAVTLRELLATANMIPDLPVIPNTTDVIVDISRQSLRVASLIHEYTKLSLPGRTIKIKIGDLKSRIDACQKDCASLKDRFTIRVHIDTNIQVKEIKGDVQQTGRMINAMIDDKQAKNIRKWLAAPDSSNNRNEARDKRLVDTCAWFLEGERFLLWKETPGFLWVKGKPGCGKSILCSSTIDKLPKATKSLGIAYFFFDGRGSDKELQLHNKLIRALISQLSDTRHGGMTEKLADLYKSCGEIQQPSDEQLQNVLRDILDRFSQVYIVIDALDECTDREKTLNWANKLISDTNRKPANLHIVVTSRPETDIHEIFAALDPHSIDVGKTNTKDIAEYLKLHMESKFTKYDENTRAKIKTELEEHAEGSFRWVVLQLAELEKCSSRHEIDMQLAELPEGLDEIYNRILKNVDKKHRADTRMFLQWLAFCERPMAIEEIAEIITADFSGNCPVFNQDKRYADPRDVLVRCSSFIAESQGVIKLSHFSVKEYLVSTRVEEYFGIDEKTSHSKISELSIAYLLQFDSLPLTKAILDSMPLARYAARYWIGHAKYGEVEPTVLQLILRLFTSESAPLINWIRMSGIDSGGYADLSLAKDTARNCSALYYSSLAGMHDISICLLHKGENANAEGGRLGNPLQAASYEGYEAIVKLLLENGAVVNAEGGRYGSALQAASFRGNKAIVKLLLENGAAVNAEGGRYGNALRAASFRGNEVVVKLLLENGAGVNVEGGEYGNALYVASFEGDEEVVKLLLENGTEVNAEGGEYGNALQAASFAGNEAIVELLLKNRAGVNAVGGVYGNALQAASFGGNIAVVKLLLKKGAKVNAEGGEYGNALQAASFGGSMVIVKLLIENGAGVNTEGGWYGNALQAASFRGNEAIARLLLGNGARVNAEGGRYGNALKAASFRGNKVIMKLLLENEAHVG